METWFEWRHTGARTGAPNGAAASAPLPGVAAFRRDQDGMREESPRRSGSDAPRSTGVPLFCGETVKGLAEPPAPDAHPATVRRHAPKAVATNRRERGIERIIGFTGKLGTGRRPR